MVRRSDGFWSVHLAHAAPTCCWRVTLVEDRLAKDRNGQEKRWVLVRPPGSRGTDLLLARASTPEESSRIGNQTGGCVFLFLHTDDFWRDYREMTARGVKFLEAPREEMYGTVAVFEDLYGYKWDLLELKRKTKLEASS
jgi:Glyoxalase/Bleomycin resistance protein/Dioxygenase superfamily